MNSDYLVKMANQIESFFKADPVREDAVEAIRSHIERFWDPRMRKAIVAHVATGGAGLGELASDAVRRLAAK